MINNNYKHSELTGKIIGCAMKVHTQLGNGFPEIIYQRCLAIELNKEALLFTKEYKMPVYYDGINVGSRSVDFLVEEKVIVELKTTSRLEDTNLAQAINYLEAYKLETGLLINFGAKSFEFKRITNERNLKNQQSKSPQ